MFPIVLVQHHLPRRRVDSIGPRDCRHSSKSGPRGTISLQLLLQRQSMLRRVVADLESPCWYDYGQNVLYEPGPDRTNASKYFLNITVVHCVINEHDSMWLELFSCCWSRFGDVDDDDGVSTEAWSVQPSRNPKHITLCCSKKRINYCCVRLSY